mgnify:CR=1 FL=1
MDERLEKALEFSNYMVTLNNHKRILREKFKEQTVYYFNGGQFTLTKDIITFVNMLVEKDNSKDIVLIDDNETPVLVPDLEDFLTDIIDAYFYAANQYHTEYKELMAKRSIGKLADYESE